MNRWVRNGGTSTRMRLTKRQQKLIPETRWSMTSDRYFYRGWWWPSKSNDGWRASTWPRPRGRACVHGLSPGCRCPSRHRLLDDQRRCRRLRQAWLLGCHGGCRRSDFNVPRRWVFHVWGGDVFATVVKLHAAYARSHKTVRCWLPHGCEDLDHYGSFVKLSNHRHN